MVIGSDLMAKYFSHSARVREWHLLSSALMRLSVSVSRVSAKCCRADLDGKHLSLYSALLSGRKEKRAMHKSRKGDLLRGAGCSGFADTKLARNCICTAAAGAAGVSSSKGENLFIAPSNAAASSIGTRLLRSAPRPHLIRPPQCERYVMRSDTLLFRLRHSIYGLANKIGETGTEENESHENEAAPLLTSGS